MFLIDAYNVLHITGVLPPHLAGVGVHGLAGLISRSRYRGEGPVLVCDGRPRTDHDEVPSDEPDSVRIMFCGAGESADDRIEELLEQARRRGDARGSTVVSSDRRLIAAAKRVRAASLSAERFLNHLAHDSVRAARMVRQAGRVPTIDLRGTVPLNAAEVDVWAEEFGIAELPGPERAAAALQEPAASDGRPAAKPDCPPAAPLREPSARPSGPVDPAASPAAWVAEAMRMWPGSLSPDDFNMQKWLDHLPDNQK